MTGSSSDPDDTLTPSKQRNLDSFLRVLRRRGFVVTRRLYAHQRILARRPWHDDAVFAESGISHDNLWDLDVDETKAL